MVVAPDNLFCPSVQYNRMLLDVTLVLHLQLVLSRLIAVLRLKQWDRILDVIVSDHP